MLVPRSFDYKFSFMMSIGLVIFGFMFGFVLFPKFLHHMIANVSDFRKNLFCDLTQSCWQFKKQAVAFFMWKSPEKYKISRRKKCS